MSDNEFNVIPMNIRYFRQLEILSFRDNDIRSIPAELEYLDKIHEIHLQVIIY